ncbi:hypothetical protein [Candidatus Chloroploca asiatica]|uniref:ATP-binding protein n=1 Tax=Candidatus Chloroploca asiatica TaxID=1506545 RepID=A0A2H3KUA1_9CHLR|nr:hypothetical protein [Candidatus Chloroploca asiatica]PDV97442.1 hypothetical protein A9Q02_18275 [Candidatus Chloroploca asiatica]
MRWFNVAGPCRPNIHYMLPPLARLPELERLIVQQSYFVLHAPRQTGKTTAMLALAQALTASGDWTAIMLSVEVGAPFSATPEQAEVSILRSWREDALLRLPMELQPLDAHQGLVLANPIYAAVIPRTLTFTTRSFFPPVAPTWIGPDGQLEPTRLLEAFLSFWRQHGQPLLGTTSYHEIAPHLVLMAFLDRVANGGGRVEREAAVGRGRLDLRLEFGHVILPIEVKVWREVNPDPQTEGLAQLDGYLAGLGLDTGWLVIFDQRPGQPPIAERTSATSATTLSGRMVTLVRG